MEEYSVSTKPLPDLEPIGVNSGDVLEGVFRAREFPGERISSLFEGRIFGLSYLGADTVCREMSRGN